MFSHNYFIAVNTDTSANGGVTGGEIKKICIGSNVREYVYVSQYITLIKITVFMCRVRRSVLVLFISLDVFFNAKYISYVSK